MTYAPTFKADLSGFYNNLPRNRQKREHEQKVRDRELEVLDLNIRSMNTADLLRKQQMATGLVNQQILKGQLQEQQNILRARQVAGEILGSIPMNEGLPVDAYQGRADAAMLQAAEELDPGVGFQLQRIWRENDVSGMAARAYEGKINQRIAQTEQAIHKMRDLQEVEGVSGGSKTAEPILKQEDRLVQLKGLRSTRKKITDLDRDEGRGLLFKTFDDGTISMERYADEEEEPMRTKVVNNVLLGEYGPGDWRPLGGSEHVEGKGTLGTANNPYTVYASDRDGVQTPIQVFSLPDGRVRIRAQPGALVEVDTKGEDGIERRETQLAETPWGQGSATFPEHVELEDGSVVRAIDYFTGNADEAAAAIYGGQGDVGSGAARAPEGALESRVGAALPATPGDSRSPDDRGMEFLFYPEEVAARTAAQRKPDTDVMGGTVAEALRSVDDSPQPERAADTPAIDRAKLWPKLLDSTKHRKYTKSGGKHPVIDLSENVAEALGTSEERMGNIMASMMLDLDPNSRNAAQVFSATFKQNVRDLFSDSGSARIAMGLFDKFLESQGDVFQRMWSNIYEFTRGRKPAEQRMLQALASSRLVNFMSDNRFGMVVNAHQAAKEEQARKAAQDRDIPEHVLVNRMPEELALAAAGKSLEDAKAGGVSIDPRTALSLLEGIGGDADMMENFYEFLHSVFRTQFSSGNSVFDPTLIPGAESLKEEFLRYAARAHFVPHQREKTGFDLSFDERQRIIPAVFKNKHKNERRTIYLIPNVDREGGGILFGYDTPALSRGFYLPKEEMSNQLITELVFPRDDWIHPGE